MEDAATTSCPTYTSPRKEMKLREVSDAANPRPGKEELRLSLSDAAAWLPTIHRSPVLGQGMLFS